MTAELPHSTGCVRQGAHPPCSPAARNSCVKLLAGSGQASPPGVELLARSPQLLCGAGGSEVWPCPLSLQCTQTMPSPPRSMFSKGLFASLEEPGSCQASGPAASLSGELLPLCIVQSAIGGVHLCRRITVEPLCPSRPAKLFSHLALAVRMKDLPELLAEIIPAGWRGPHRVCVAWWPGCRKH